LPVAETAPAISPVGTSATFTFSPAWTDHRTARQAIPTLPPPRCRCLLEPQS